MKTNDWSRLLIGGFMLLCSIASNAQTTAGSSTVLVFPLVAQTGSYKSDIFVGNPQSQPITVNVTFYVALTSSAGVAGPKNCGQIVIPSGAVTSFTLPSQCGAALNLTKVYHGMLILEDAAAEKTNYFFAYSRTQNVKGNGFSVEAFPAGSFSGQVSVVYGLKRQAATPIYQTNCFVGALGEAVDYKIELFDGTGAAIGSAVTGSLQPYEMIRHLDIFAAAGAPSGDYFNVKARFDNTNTGEPAYVGFCTVQESTQFGADFRIAKSADAQDNRQRRKVCYSQDTCGTVTTSSPATITDAGTKNIHQFLVQQPDYVKCELVSARVDDLEMQIRGPGDVFTSAVWVSSPPYDSGGNGKTSFYIYTGSRYAVNGGFSTRWYIDVSYREGSANSTVPITYGITCYSGNGVSVPWFRAYDIDNF
jgi:hypothetical protein